MALQKTLQRKMQKTVLAFALLAGIATPANAQSELEKQLAIATAGASPQGATQASVKPAWVVPNDGSKTDAPCLMIFRDGTSVMGYLGPFKGWDESYFIVSGPNVPSTSKPRSLRVALASEGDSDQTVRAFNYPAGNGQYAILFKLTDFSAALDAMDDRENVAVIVMEPSENRYKQAVFSASWTGGHAARDQIRSCLAKMK